MNGRTARGILERFVRQMGGTIQVFKNYGKENQTEQTYKALKNTKTKSPSSPDVFQLLERVDIVEGDVIQQKNSPDLWLVTKAESFMIGDDFVHFEVDVERANAEGLSRRQPPQPAAIVNVGGSVYGGMQIASPNATQNISVTVNPKLEAAIGALRAVVRDAEELDEHDKDDVNHELDRVSELAKREPNEKTKTSINEKLTTVEKMLSISAKLAKIAGPLVLAIRTVCCG